MNIDESIRLTKRMWDDGRNGASLDGDHYWIEDAYCVSPPIQDPHPPILGGGQGKQVTLKLVAKYADVWNTDVFNGDVETLEHKIDVIENHCKTVGPSPDDIEYSWDGHVICTRDGDTFDGLVGRPRHLHPRRGHV